MASTHEHFHEEAGPLEGFIIHHLSIGLSYNLGGSASEDDGSGEGGGMDGKEEKMEKKIL